MRSGSDRLDDATAVTAAQLRGIVERLIAAGQWQTGDPHIVIVSDAGYDVTRLAWVLRDLPVELVGRVRSDRVMRLPKPPRMHGVNGRPPKHGPEFRFTKPETWPEPAITTVTDTTNYGKAETQAWDRVHPRLTQRSSWLDHDGELSLVEGTLMRLKVEHLSKDRDAPPVWLWSSKTGATPDDVDRFWKAFLRRFDLEHTFRFAKQNLGWTTPKLRAPEAADRWTWILIVAPTQLRLARPLAADLRHPWEKPTASDRLTPARVRRGFRNIRAHLACPARVPKPPPGPPQARHRPQNTSHGHRVHVHYFAVSDIPKGATPGYLVWRLSIKWRNAVDQALASLRLTHAQYVLLSSLFGMERSGLLPSQRELADHTGLEALYVSKLARSLESAGLVRRTRDADDIRIIRLALTGAGRETVRPAIDVVQVLHDQLLAPLGGRDDPRTAALVGTLTSLLETPLAPSD